MSLPLLIRDAIDDGVANPRGQSLAVLSIVFACLSVVFVSARLFTRHFIHKSLGPDDYLIIAAACLAVTMAVSYNEEVANGFGLHKKQVSAAHLIVAMKWFFVAQLLYKVAICLVKLSILFFYMRIFQSKSFKKAVYAVGGVVVTYSFASICVTIWQCNPIPKTWNRAIAGKCIEIGKVWYSTSVMAIVTDVAIIVLPMYQIRRLQLPLPQKIALCLLFSLGIFIIACTIVRMAVVGPAVAAVDTPYYQATSNSWTFLEVNVAIICACLPDLKGLLTKLCACSSRNNSTNSRSQYSHTLSRDNYGSRNIMPSYNSKTGMDNASDEEFILQGLPSVMKTTEIDIKYSNAHLEDGRTVRESRRASGITSKVSVRGR